MVENRGSTVYTFCYKSLVLKWKKYFSTWIVRTRVRASLTGGFGVAMNKRTMYKFYAAIQVVHRFFASAWLSWSVVHPSLRLPLSRGSRQGHQTRCQISAKLPLIVLTYPNLTYRAKNSRQLDLRAMSAWAVRWPTFRSVISPTVEIK